MAGDKPKAVYTCEEVAELVRVNRTTVWRWCKSGQLGYEVLNGRIRIPSSKIREAVPATFESIRDLEDE